ncbi:MAG: hypothetical protein WCD31_10390 [Gillisia sp.]
MKKVLFTGLSIAALIFTGCSNSNDAPIEQLASCTDGIQNGTETAVDCGGACSPCSNPNPTPDQQDLSGFISEDMTLSNDRIWTLSGKVVVQDGVTLTIQPGTIIKGKEGENASASALIIARGALINAKGTAENPIVFTSINDNIALGEKFGTNLTANDRGLWGGVLLLGRAPISVGGDSEEAQIEGIPANDEFGRYGGTDPEDNSGVFEYVSIRHGGALIGSGNEINGVSFGGVGNGTTVDHIEVVGNLDDGYEFFGGTVSPKSLLAYKGGDDGLDIDQAYGGTISNSVVVQGEASDHGLEVDGAEGTATASFTMDGITIIGLPTAADKGQIAAFRDSSMGTLKNIYAKNFNSNQFVELSDEGSAANYTAGDLNFSNWEIALMDGETISGMFKDKTNTSSFSADAPNFATSVTEGSQTVGADMSQFDWTYAKSKGAF